ncbi:hypothetical protein P171DRAFT_449837 [Karstenula rhodostoma CBS 690.94]|uniref:Uncharacterized protein n=1 Tax=Karstenula rhodostoma CBS 690.94 TaxID=1392251 RepID=A0A9P4U469_9PLEO|nr:hypothetical protein P171DRAFT_449837 [Karstenula rhodostoma CBS 690.94]
MIGSGRAIRDLAQRKRLLLNYVSQVDMPNQLHGSLICPAEGPACITVQRALPAALHCSKAVVATLGCITLLTTACAYRAYRTAYQSNAKLAMTGARAARRHRRFAVLAQRERRMPPER